MKYKGSRSKKTILSQFLDKVSVSKSIGYPEQIFHLKAHPNKIFKFCDTLVILKLQSAHKIFAILDYKLKECNHFEDHHPYKSSIFMEI